MAQAGVFAPDVAIDAEAVVRVNGVVREHVSMTWAGDTTGGLPDQVVSAGTGMRSRTGTIVWAQQDAVEDEPPHPLRQSSGWPPREGDEVVIDATVDTGTGPYTFRRFTGRLGRTTGSLTDGSLASEITDTLGDSLRALVNIPPMITGNYTRSYQIAYRAMEQAGLGVLPPPDSSTVAHVAGQGGNEPVVGTIQSGTGAIGYGDPYGLLKITNLRIETTRTTRTEPRMLVMGRASSNEDSEIAASLSNGTRISLRHNRTTRNLGLFVSGVGWVLNTTSVDSSPLPILAFQTLINGLRVFTSPTTWTDVTTYTVPSGVGVRWVEGEMVIGQSVRYLPGSDNGPALAATVPKFPAAWQYSALETEYLGATRSIENVTARSVVDSWSEATLASVWMDELGKTWCVARDRLVARGVSRTMRIDERVFSGSWSVGDDSVRSRVIVKASQPAINRPKATEDRALIYQEGSVRTFETSETVERFIEADPEVEWGPVDLTASHYSNGQISGDGPAKGTYIHGVTVPTNDSTAKDQWIWHANNPGTYNILIEQLGHRTLKLTETVVPPPGRVAYLKAPDEDATTSLRTAYRDVPSPTIRGRWTTSWASYTVTGSSTGPSWAEDLEHDASWFLTPSNAQVFANALSAEVTAPMPTLSRVDTLWDPRRQIGDVEDWVAVDRDGNETWRARVLVTGYSEAWDGRVPTQAVDVRVMSWTDPHDGKTYGDLAAVYARYSNLSGTYQQVYDALPDSR